MSETHPAAGPAQKVATAASAAEPEAKAIEGVRDWILLVALTDKRILSDEWHGLDEGKAVAVIGLIGASELPQELFEVVARDMRPMVQAALHAGGVLKHPKALTVADYLGARHVQLAELVPRARAGVISLLKGAQVKVLRPEEVQGICGIARDAVHPDTIAAVMFYVQSLPEVARAALTNPLVTGKSPDEAHTAKLARQYPDRPAQLQVAKGVMVGPLIQAMVTIFRNGSREKDSWSPLVVQVYKLISGSADFHGFLEPVLRIVRSAPQVVIAFIEDEEIADATLRNQILPIATVVRPHQDDIAWAPVFRSLRMRRNSLYKGAIRNELSARLRTAAESNV